MLATGGAPAFQIISEDGEIMMFLSEAERSIITPGADTLLVTSIIMVFFLVVA